MNAYCYYARSDEVREAHELGLSYGKYRAYCEYRALDPSITVEEVQRMTMRELRDAIDAAVFGRDAGRAWKTGMRHGGRGPWQRAGRGQGNGGGARQALGGPRPPRKFKAGRPFKRPSRPFYLGKRFQISAARGLFASFFLAQVLPG